MKQPIRTCLLAFGLVIGALSAFCELPDPLVLDSGQAVRTVKEWEEQRRPELLELFRTQVYGRAPIGRPDDLSFRLIEEDRNAIGGKATLKRIEISFSGPGGSGKIEPVIFIPNGRKSPAPGFLLICHRGKENFDPTRENKSPFWPAEELIARGYAAIAFHVSDVDADDRKDINFKSGVHGIFDGPERAPDAWGSIAAWAWGASRVMDYLETSEEIDATRIGVVGHSRGGKAALWCGAEDERFALVVSNDSGCTGAALARNKKGETVARINTNFPHWFCENYKQYNDKEEDLPIDQHQLIALIAPRQAYVASASEDGWADPEGEFLSCLYASPVWQLWGHQGLTASEQPPVNSPVHSGHIGRHLREGKHGMELSDWNWYMDFADKHMIK
jgi:dienelactone hydrolase